ncbi:MAG: AtpZ/AtpI family protein [Anaerolineae bacterium]|nr:AtpZ/AtpI family protein [Anaerolineae bacterium]
MRQFSLLAQALELAWVVALSILIPLGIGLWLDRRFDSAPWLTLVGMVVGVVASTVNVLRQMSAIFRALDEEYAARKARRRAENVADSPADEKEETD